MSMQGLERQRAGPEQAAGFAVVVALHGFALWGLLQHRLTPTPQEAATLFVNFIAPPAPEKREEPQRPPPPKPKPIEKLQPRQIVAEIPVVAPTDYVAPPQPLPAPVIEAPSMPLPTGPVTLATELAVACSERAAPVYPPRSRRNGEEGTVVLYVELSETGAVASARVRSSSGFVRLDDAALATVRTWRCKPAQRNGQPVHSSALQPFKFVLQGS